MKKISKTQTFLEILCCEKSIKLHQKRKKKYEILANWSNCVFSLFNRKVKMLETITAHINIEKPNETVIKHAFYIFLLKIKFYKDVI